MQQPTTRQDQQREQRITRLFILAIACYFILQIVVRLMLTDSLAMDESEQALLYAHPALGYGTQPPLYSWILWVLFSTLGFNIFVLALLKNAMLFGTYASLFFVARPKLGALGAAAVSASMLMLPDIAWESQRDLTHTVLLTALCAGTLWGYFALLRRPDRLRYALFGLLIGAGMLSKYNYAIFIGGLAGTSLVLREHRVVVWNRKLLLSAAIALVCVAPHTWWLVHHVGDASIGTLDKMRVGSHHGYVRAVLRGYGSMLGEICHFFTPLWIVYGLVAFRQFRRASVDAGSEDARFFKVLYLFFFVLMSAIILGGRISTIKARWIEQLLFLLPLTLFVMVPALRQDVVYRRILRVAAGFGVAILLAIPLRVQIGPYFHSYTRSHFPYERLSDELAQRFPQANTLLVGEKLATGNLYFHRPSLPTYMLSRFLEQPLPLHGQVLFVTPSDMRAGELESLLQAYPEAKVVKQGELRIPYKKSYQGDAMAFDYALLDMGSGETPRKP